MRIYFKPSFRKFVKKQPRPFQLVIEDEVEKIVEDPELGVSKKGDLSDFRIHKFFYHKQTFLTSYRQWESDIVFYTLGNHENFYRELKRYLKGTGRS
jgi:hypothetical protein